MKKKKKYLWMLAAILICGLTAVTLSACSSGDDDNKTETPQEQTVKMFYVVEVSDDVLKVADVEVNNVDQTGAKQKEVMTSKEWKKTLNAKTLPLTKGLWAKLTSKGAVASGNYQLKVTTVAGYEAQLANGKKIFDGHATEYPNGTYRDLYLYCAQHTLGSHVGIYNYTHFGNLYTTGPKDFFVKNI